MYIKCIDCHLNISTCDTECSNEDFISLKEDSIVPEPAAGKVPPNKPIPYTPVEDTDELEKSINEANPEIIKARMREENTKIRIRNKRKSIREMLGR